MARDSFSPQTKLSQHDFDTLERLGAVKLVPEARKRIEVALQEYECQRDARPAARNQALALGRSLERTMTLINKMREERPQLLKHLANAGMASVDADLVRLQEFKDRCKKYVGRGGRPRDVFKRKLLINLEDLFKAAGGRTTGISRGTKERHGQFLDFAHSALSHLPVSIRPQSKGSLGAEWERIYSGRKKGEQEIHLSHPKLFDISISRRVRRT